MFPQSNMPCFSRGEVLFEEIKERISTWFNNGGANVNEFKELVDRIC